jgi:hypothetical protein
LPAESDANAKAEEGTDAAANWKPSSNFACSSIYSYQTLNV